MSVKYHFFGKNLLINRDLLNRDNLNWNLTQQGFTHQHVLFVNQIHGKEIVVIDDTKKIHGESNLPKADALICNLPNVAIGVVTADCAPILFYDEEKKIIAATHAGWRGAKAGIIQETVSAMKNLGAKKIHAVIGPVIHQHSYEDSEEFLNDFLNENLANQKFIQV